MSFENLTITLTVSGTAITDITTEAQARRCIADGSLTAKTPVGVYRGKGRSKTVPAGKVPELMPLLGIEPAPAKPRQPRKPATVPAAAPAPSRPAATSASLPKSSYVVNVPPLEILGIKPPAAGSSTVEVHAGTEPPLAEKPLAASQGLEETGASEARRTLTTKEWTIWATIAVICVVAVVVTTWIVKSNGNREPAGPVAPPPTPTPTPSPPPPPSPKPTRGNEIRFMMIDGEFLAGIDGAGLGHLERGDEVYGLEKGPWFMGNSPQLGDGAVPTAWLSMNRPPPLTGGKVNGYMPVQLAVGVWKDWQRKSPRGQQLLPGQDVYVVGYGPDWAEINLQPGAGKTAPRIAYIAKDAVAPRPDPAPARGDLPPPSRPPPPPPPAKPIFIASQFFTSGPEPRDFEANYPEGAKRAGLDRKIRLTCTLTAEARVDKCTSDRNPAGLGKAAVTLSRFYKIDLDRTDAAPGARVSFDVEFPPPRKRPGFGPKGLSIP